MERVVKKGEKERITLSIYGSKCHGCGEEKDSLKEKYYPQFEQYVLCCDDCKGKFDEIAKKKAYKERTKNPIKYLKDFGIAPRYIECSFDNFNGGKQYVSFLKNFIKTSDKSLFLTGTYGCGKTHLAVSICRELIKFEKYYSMKFITGAEMLLNIRKSFSDENISEEQIITQYSSVDILFIDDFGAEKTTEWVRATLYLIIDRRDREMKPTIITSNLSLSEIAGKIDGRISSRISNGTIMEINLPDYRSKRT